MAHHPAKVSSSSVAVPHHCGLLPSCRSSPLARGTFVRCARKLRSDRSLHECRFGWAAGLPPMLSVAAFLPLPAAPGGRRSTGIGRSCFQVRLDIRFRTPTLVSPRGVRASPRIAPGWAVSWGSPHVPGGTGRLRRSWPLSRFRSCSTSVRCRSPFPVRGARRRTRWFDGSPGHLKSSGFQGVPSFPHRPSTHARVCRPADFRVLLHRRVQAGPRVLRHTDHLFLPWVCFPFEASLARPTEVPCGSSGHLSVSRGVIPVPVSTPLASGEGCGLRVRDRLSGLAGCRFHR